MLQHKPPTDLLGGPILTQFLSNQPLQAQIRREQTQLRSFRVPPGPVVCLDGPVPAPAAMTADLATDRRRRPTDTFGDLPNRLTRGEPARDLLALRQAQHERRACPLGRNDPTVGLDNAVNRTRVLPQGTADLAQRLPTLPSLPQLTFLQ